MITELGLGFFICITKAHLFTSKALENDLAFVLSLDVSILLSCLAFKKLFLAVLGLCCCVQAFPARGEWGLLSGCGVRASHCHGLSWCRAPSLGHAGSVIVAECLSCSLACGILLDRGSNPCPEHWQVDS